MAGAGGGNSIMTGPLNLVVYEGAINTTINCSVSNPAVLDWTFNPFSGASDSNYLTTNGQLYPSFNESFATVGQFLSEVFTLVVFNATISPPNGLTYSTAGLYKCYQAGTSSSASAYLVVIRTDPVCSSNFTQSTGMLQSGDAIQLSCTIVYGSIRDGMGNGIDAVMTWSVNGQPIQTENATFTINTSPTEVTASSTLLISDNFDATYECETTFSQPSEVSPGLATNAPDYLKTCSISLSDLHETGCQTATATPPTPTTTIVGGLTTTDSSTISTTPSTSSTTSTTSARPTITTTTTTTPSAPTPTTTIGLPHCTGIFQFISNLLRASCYSDWLICSSETSILSIILRQDCSSHCRSMKYSDGKCMSSTSVGCPCIHPGNKKCICS